MVIILHKIYVSVFVFFYIILYILIHVYLLKGQYRLKSLVRHVQKNRTPQSSRMGLHEITLLWPYPGDRGLPRSVRQAVETNCL